MKKMLIMMEIRRNNQKMTIKIMMKTKKWNCKIVQRRMMKKMMRFCKRSLNLSNRSTLNGL